MYRSVLVPLDGSGFGEQALPLALTIACRAGATLELVHVHSPLPAVYADSPVVFDDSLDLHLKRHQQDYLDGIVKRLASVSSVPVRSVLLEGEIGATLRATAESTGVDLVVMTTHGRGPLGRFWLGSVADILVRELSMPLLFVRPGEAAADFAKEVVLQHVLLPLDGTVLAEQMLEPAVALGSLMDADYTLLRVIKPILLVDYSPVGVAVAPEVYSLSLSVEKVQQQLHQEATDYLERVAERLRARSLRVQTRVAVEQQPAVAILHQAVAPAIDVVALETHGRRGLARLLLGSVADKVLRGASVPVLVHRPVYE
jgi:nucleotide-binding universal stress UspA family protein